MIEIVYPDVFCHKIHQHVASLAFANTWGPEIATEQMLMGKFLVYMLVLSACMGLPLIDSVEKNGDTKKLADA